MNAVATSSYNAASLQEFKLPDKVTIYDSTLRDGEQMPGVAFRHAEKIEIVRMLSEVCVPQVEAGFPAVSKGEKRAVKGIAQDGERVDDATLVQIVKICRGE